LIRILLVASSPALRAGLRAMLSSDAEMRVVAERSTWHGVMEGKAEADVVITTPASVSTGLLNTPITVPILFLQDDPLTNQRMQTSAVWGALPLETSDGELCAAVHALAEGLIVGARGLLFGTTGEKAGNGPLTDRETQVLGLLAKGMANKQIAAALGISEHTVKFHISSICGKLNAANRTQAVREGLRNGWILL
jgi:DNA-binding NarL/FixJ family response regulator